MFSFECVVMRTVSHFSKWFERNASTSWRRHSTRQHFEAQKATHYNVCGFLNIFFLCFGYFKETIPLIMSDQAGYSPSFKRPCEILRMRRKRARLSTSGRDSTGSPAQSDSSPPCVRPFSPGPLFNTHSREGGGTKRRNPFASIENTYSPKKKLVIYNEDGNAEAVDLDKMKKSSNKEGDEDMSTKTVCQTFLPFSARLTEAENRDFKDISFKVCSTV